MNEFERQEQCPCRSPGCCIPCRMERMREIVAEALADATPVPMPVEDEEPTRCERPAREKP